MLNRVKHTTRGRGCRGGKGREGRGQGMREGLCYREGKGRGGRGRANSEDEVTMVRRAELL